MFSQAKKRARWGIWGAGEGIEVARPYRKSCLEELGDFLGQGSLRIHTYVPVPDPDLEIRGAQSSRPLDKGARSPKKIFPALPASVWSKNKAGGCRAPWAPPLDPPLCPVVARFLSIQT